MVQFYKKILQRRTIMEGLTQERRMLIASRIKEIRNDYDLTLEEMASKIGLTKATLSRYENGEIDNIPMGRIRDIGEIFRINPAWILNWSDSKFVTKYEAKFKTIPILGCIAAGVPILAQEDIIGLASVDEKDSTDFCLIVKGDSMINARIYDGDTVFIKKQSDVEHGEIAAVLLDNEVTLKRVYKVNGTVILHAENPAYQDLVLNQKDYQRIEILGKAISVKFKI